MELDKCIQERRSVRKYNKKKVSWELISEIMESGEHAPCAGGIQNYYFIVVKSNKTKEAISRACSQLWMLDAPYFIVVCNDKNKMKKFYEQEGGHYAIQNCAVVAQTMLLKAHSLGLSSCWVGSYDDIQLQRILKLPDHVNVESILVFGYSDSKSKEPRRFPLDRMTYFEEFGNTKK